MILLACPISAPDNNTAYLPRQILSGDGVFNLESTASILGYFISDDVIAKTPFSQPGGPNDYDRFHLELSKPRTPPRDKSHWSNFTNCSTHVGELQMSELRYHSVCEVSKKCGDGCWEGETPSGPTNLANIK